MVSLDRALISVWDKTGLEELAASLEKNDIDMIATGGTAEYLREAGFEVEPVSEITGSEEMLSGRVKTLHPALYAGILARRDVEDDMEQLDENGIMPIDIVVCNLYPFHEQVEKSPGDVSGAAGMIDIGGVSLLRAAAKNYRDVCVLSSPEQYGEMISALEEDGPDGDKRQHWAERAFARVTCYDADISANFPAWQGEDMDELSILAGKKHYDLKYGENPHQKAALYRSFFQDGDDMSDSLLDARQLNGDELSFNNIRDAAAAVEIMQEFPDRPAAVIIKHTNPCVLALGSSPVVAFRRAYAGDPQSAYGGIAGLNREITPAVAKEMAGGRKFLEVVVAPDFTDEACEILIDRWSDIRLLALEDIHSAATGHEINTLPGGFLLQEKDLHSTTAEDLEVVVGGELDEEEEDELIFAWKAVKHVKSNAIVLARDNALVGVGAGQMSRIDALHLAGKKASGRQRGGILASDAFFPFADAIQEAEELGVGTIIQPGGSIRDAEVKKACERAGIRMVFTGTRHFRH